MAGRRDAGVNEDDEEVKSSGSSLDGGVLLDFGERAQLCCP